MSCQHVILVPKLGTPGQFKKTYLNIMRIFGNAVRLLEDFMFLTIKKMCGYARSTRVEILIMLDVKILKIR